MLSIPNTPTFFEWIVLIHDDPVRAKQHVVSLQTQIRKQGLMGDPALTISIEAYDRAQHLLDSQLSGPQQAERISYLRRLGQASLGSYPDSEAWRKLIQDEPTFAQDLCMALKTKYALMGSQTPQPLVRSVDIYHSLTAKKAK